MNLQGQPATPARGAVHTPLPLVDAKTTAAVDGEPISAQITGHKPSALAEKHYRRRPLDLLRKWHDQIEGWILEQARVPVPAGVDTLPEVVTTKGRH